MRYEQLVREMNDSIALIDDAALRYDIDAELLRYAWDASKHPRGGKNKGHFAKKSGGGARGESGAKVTKPKPKAAKPASKKPVAPASKAKAKVKTPVLARSGKHLDKALDAVAGNKPKLKDDYFWTDEVDKGVEEAKAAIDAAPDDPAEVINQAEAAQPKVDEAMSKVDLPPEAKKAAEAIVDEHTDTLMAKLKRYGKDAAKLVGGLGLLGVSAGLGLGSLTLGAAAISTSISSGVAGTDIALSGAMGIAMCPMAWGAAACLASGLDLMASIGRHARESDMPMDKIKQIAREYYDGIMQDWKKAWKPEWANSGRRAKQSYHAMISQRGGK